MCYRQRWVLESLSCLGFHGVFFTNRAVGDPGKPCFFREQFSYHVIYPALAINTEQEYLPFDLVQAPRRFTTLRWFPMWMRIFNSDMSALCSLAVAPSENKVTMSSWLLQPSFTHTESYQSPNLFKRFYSFFI